MTVNQSRHTGNHSKPIGRADSIVRITLTSSDWSETRDIGRESLSGDCDRFSALCSRSGELLRLDDELEPIDLERDRDALTLPFSPDPTDDDDDDEFEADEPGRDSSLSILSMSVIYADGVSNIPMASQYNVWKMETR